MIASRTRSRAESSGGLSRRDLLRTALVGAGGVALGGALAGCATPGAVGAGRTPVMIWDLFSGGDGALMQEMVGAVASANPDIAVESTTLAWGPPYYTKLAMASSGGRPPEAAVMHMSRLAGYAPGGLLEPFDLDALAQLGVREEHFAPAVWQKAQYDGQLYALPLDTHPYITFHNPTIIKDAGLARADGKLDLDAVAGADAFLAAGRAMAEVTGETGVGWGYQRDPAGCWRMFWGLYSQNGGEYELTPGRPAALDEEAAAEVFEFLQEMVDGTVAAKNQDGNAAAARFMSQRTGMMFAGEWDLPMFRDALPDVGATQFPAIFDTPANYADSHAFVLPRQGQPDPAGARGDLSRPRRPPQGGADLGLGRAHPRLPAHRRGARVPGAHAAARLRTRCRRSRSSIPTPGSPAAAATSRTAWPTR